MHVSGIFKTLEPLLYGFEGPHRQKISECYSAILEEQIKQKKKRKS